MTSDASELARRLGPLRRALLRATRTAADLPDIPDAQIEVLRALVEDPSSTPGGLATRLDLARSTVSNLVKAMVTNGLVERTAATTDLRSAQLCASPKAVELLARYDRSSSQVLSDALATLPERDRRAVAAALPALAAITQVLQRP
ncbi:hypothetical protein CH293_07470 [Rhodococcus sp. 14-2470-1b]|jgi:DNA-binding MarR family transcriptional regulator|uniref:MarR family winged helix-turn-helix transcriptional regulator n=1 Tax=unclassified Rhodococcus (in: high G+C Gram-positive bacteria) TaxID=192944 RepID=UPI000B9BAC78|nr:MarR family winged helix-turn-helix transcriptional regulator [Rhodococcus sp. 14-2470-1b]OZF54541.1 hypothetical protein CH293_07470 [Rhodococcus sp. 14-2470-1b]